MFNDFTRWQQHALPNEELSQDGIVLVMMAIISQPMTKSWAYKMKNSLFVKYFNTFMSKYSYSMLVKLFDNLNFRFILKQYLVSDGFVDTKETTNTMIENREAYENAAYQFILI